MVFSTVLGLLIDFGKKWFANPDEVYRFLWGWRFVWCALGVFFAVLMYRQWQKLGGVDNYRAPAPWKDEKFEEMENSPVVPADRRFVKLGTYLWDGVVALYIIGGVIFPFLGAKSGFVLWIVPSSAAVLGLWMIFRLNLAAKMKRGTTPHHGLLILTAVQQFLLLAVAAVQFFLTAGTEMAVKLYCFELLLCAFTILLLLFSVKLECAAPVQSSGALRR